MNSSLEISPYEKSRIIIGVFIMLTIAAIHWYRVGSYLPGDFYIFYYSYASDFIIPFGLYFLLTMNEIQVRFLQKWQMKAVLVFGGATLTEIMQSFGFYVFGVSFDVLDIVAFALGTGLAVVTDIYLFKRFIPFWNLSGLENNL